jgi:hypothetical protein
MLVNCIEVKNSQVREMCVHDPFTIYTKRTPYFITAVNR